MHNPVIIGIINTKHILIKGQTETQIIETLIKEIIPIMDKLLLPINPTTKQPILRQIMVDNRKTSDGRIRGPDPD